MSQKDLRKRPIKQETDEQETDKQETDNQEAAPCSPMLDPAGATSASCRLSVNREPKWTDAKPIRQTYPAIKLRAGRQRRPPEPYL